MKMGGRLELLEICCLLLLTGNSLCRDSQQTEHLSSYQLTVPRPIGGRLRRDADGRPPNQDHCHYQGYVQDLEGSAAAMSICNGLRGVLHLADNSYGIEPSDSAPDQHLVYRLQDFKYMNQNEMAVRDEMVHLANFIDSIYQQLNLRVVLVGLEIWTQQNLISIDGGAGEVLSRFTQWREKHLAYSAPYCGNRLVDMGEDCDCGTQKYLPGGSVCRSSSDECDLPEFCNGSSSLCQSDVFIQNGHPCRSLQAVCYNGKCQHYDGQCQAIFGSKAKAAPEICFKEVNSKGDRFGNCGYHNYGHKKCESRNAMCGKLQCSNVKGVNVFGVKPALITTTIGEAECHGVDFALGTDVPDPGMVAEGSRCGEGKVCMNFECSSVDVLNYDCDVERKCHGHGVCNSNRNCHCEYGWASPFCEVKGYGGSVDSGPTWNDKDTSVRDGLLVFFFLVLPLLALGAFVFLRRNELLRRVGLSRRKRSQGYRADGAALANPSRPPPIAQPPPVTRGNANNIVRDGVVETSRTAPTSYALKPPPPPL
ncbi:Disintegrin and metalloproteinase domain-containing protein 9 [Liparis tanakae]|uniref:Disintegrin and metalloproteinase domain-containing protein 9 n=1 Tax=Liparis tanakae TaxID=230148 RepID=A0A4Z2F7Y4_9TELE|nr:Disintegrin and metalloproteinase domain-containing protein 9 [Liparis tanakae]